MQSETEDDPSWVKDENLTPRRRSLPSRDKIIKDRRTTTTTSEEGLFSTESAMRQHREKGDGDFTFEDENSNTTEKETPRRYRKYKMERTKRQIFSKELQQQVRQMASSQKKDTKQTTTTKKKKDKGQPEEPQQQPKRYNNVRKSI